MERFLELQRGFEGNIASRLLTSLAMCLPALQQLLSSSSSQDPKIASDGTAIAQHTQQALSILQGVALIHAESKAFLGRKSSIHLLLDILSISRHAPSQSTTSSDPSSGGSNASPSPDVSRLASAVLDTLLCVLVDSPPALRVFEEASGVEGVVKTLKRTGVAREVRMKCLEFLYFYLLPEDGTPSANFRSTSSPMRPPVDTSFSKSIMSAQSRSVPGSPMHFGAYPTPLPIPLNETPQSSFIANDSQVLSGADTRSNERPSTPPTRRSRELSTKEASESTKSAALQMLQQEIDFVPVSPKKAQVAQLGVGTPGKPRVINLNRDSASGTPINKKLGEVSGSTSAKPLIFPSFSPSTPAKKKTVLMRPAELRLKGEGVSTPVKEGKRPEAKSHSRGNSLVGGKKEALSRSGSSNALEESTNKSHTPAPPSPTRPSQLSVAGNWPSNHPISQQQRPRIRSTEEKKELLGNWLGNVDALVAGVQKAGVWGLA
ncbi:hypothetical protein M407DRAFT_13836 [Tulasnella calospora MUT 4182]|uniref:Cell division control protein 14 n=1 Tax=Tulasnella calospora MUT 4182 TaxID=1051891 RepID=A0A0C3QVS6_9AGAM|nr:hypothetical protein M407DRAFT_13836 [Tulasnella calospora MUT 4182]